jgi:hypothetical protein
MKPTTQSDLGFAINLDTIESFTLADAFFTIDFRDGSILKFKARQSVFTHGRAVQMGVVPVFPSCLLMGGLVPADGLTRCQGCGSEVKPDGSETIDNLCWDCIAATEDVARTIVSWRTLFPGRTAGMIRAALFGPKKPATLTGIDWSVILTAAMYPNQK